MAHWQDVAAGSRTLEDFEAYVLDVIKSEHPEWIEPNGDCSRCVAYYRSLDYAIELLE